MDTLFAYLDPGTGSLVLQALVAGFAGFVVAGKYGRRWLREHFRKPRPTSSLIAEQTLLPAGDVLQAAIASEPNSRTFALEAEQSNQTVA